MRGFRLFALVPFVALATACKDDAAGAFVDPLTTWQLFCASGGVCTFKPHEQTEDVEFKVQCSRDSATGLAVQISSEANEELGLSDATLSISRLDPASNSCIVTVTDAQMFGGGPITVQDSCGVGGCVVQGALDVDGWDFSGTITCNKLQQAADPTRLFRLNSKGDAMAVNLRVDCG